MLSSWHSSSSLAINLLSNGVVEILSNVRTERERTEGERRATSWVGGDEFSFSLVPEVEEFLRRGGTDQSRMGDSTETHTGNVSRRGVDYEMMSESARLDEKSNPRNRVLKNRV